MTFDFAAINARLLSDAIRVARGEKLDPIPEGRKWHWADPDWTLIPWTKLDPPKTPQIEFLGDE